MASFSTSYGLCSLIDQKGLLGVSPDEDGCALVTLGKNIVIRCRLADQKQLTSWSSTQKLTAKVVYNSEEDVYVGVFDGLNVKLWNRTEPSIEKLKKYKCGDVIHEILVFKKDELTRLLVLKKTGACVDLNNLINHQTEPTDGFLEAGEDILSACVVVHEDKHSYLVLVTRAKKKGVSCYSVALDPDTLEVYLSTLASIKIRKPDAKLLGHTIAAASSANTLKTFWSDGFLYSLDLPLQPELPESMPGKFCGTVTGVSCKSEVALAAVGPDHLVIYAGDAAEEGAILGIYNTNFGMMQAQTSFKMVHKPPRLWVVEGRVAVAMGQRLVCVPYTLQTENLSALVGSRLAAVQTRQDDIIQVVPSMSWEDGVPEGPKPPTTDFPASVKERLETLRGEGWSEASVCQAVLAEVVESGDTEGLSWCLDHFVDISCQQLVLLMERILSSTPSQEDSQPVDGCHKNPIEPAWRALLIDKMLAIPVDRTTLLDNVRNRLSFDSALMFLRYLSFLMASSSLHDFPSLFQWVSVIMDGFYQQLVLSRDPAVKEILVQLRAALDQHIGSLQELKQLIPLLVRLHKGQDLMTAKPNTSGTYTIDRIPIYDD